MVYSLSDRLRGYNNAAKNTDWVRFIQDHKEYIKLQSNRRRLTLNEVSVYKHRIKEFIIVQQICTYELIWILLLINNLLDTVSLENKTFLYVPSSEIINNLRKKYVTYIGKKSL